ncbi:MAG: long-chain fatty acid--CoA ligase [Chloroflexota bacterium]|nr:long-chain fatty acid--CoA ligase [Chloroflexota bacterium]
MEPLQLPESERAPNLVELFHRSVARDPEHEALRWRPGRGHGAGQPAGDDADAWRARTYGEMWSWVTSASLGLQELGVGDGDRVCIMSRTRPEWLVSDVATLALGAISCPIYPQLEAAQAAYIINNVGARVVFAETPSQAAKIASVRPTCPSLERVIVFDVRADAGELLSLDAVVARGATLAADATRSAAWEERWRAFTRDRIATVIHTSGTTANPKGAVITHGNLIFNFEAASQAIDFYPSDLFLSWLPLSHVFERLTGMVVPLARGSTIVYAEPLIERLPANMAEVRPTVMCAVPRLYERVYGRVRAAVDEGSRARQRIFHWAVALGAQKYANHAASHADSWWLRARLRVADRLVFSKIRERTGGRVRYFVSGAAALSREVGEFFYAMGMLVLEGYGMTETSPFISVNRPDTFRFGTVGHPAPGTEVAIDGETGEILVRGPQVMQGYWNDPVETGRAIDRDGWLHTGDIGELDADGRLRITDRLKNIIVLNNGKNVTPGPMEAALVASRYIAQAVILGDNQPYTGALIAPDFDELERWAADEGLAEMPPEQLVDERRVVRFIEGEVRRALADFSVFERPRRVALLPRELSEEEGELTPTLKTKLRVVNERWAERIATLFDGGASGGE